MYCRLCFISPQHFLSCSCQPSHFSAENNYIGIWCELGSAYFQVKFVHEKKVLLLEAKKCIHRTAACVLRYGITQWLWHRQGKKSIACGITQWLWHKQPPKTNSMWNSPEKLAPAELQLYGLILSEGIGGNCGIIMPRCLCSALIKKFRNVAETVSSRWVE